MSRRTGKTIVVKVGSTTLTRADGLLDDEYVDGLVGQLCLLRDSGPPLVLVTSGAIRSGMAWLQLGETRTMPEKQAAAATGMMRLAHAYQEQLGQYGLTVAQVLLTLDDTEDRRRYINARNTIEALLRLGAVPLINENDTVATDEIRFGDNDRLAGRVAAMISADTLILLTDIDGLYTADPGKDPNATHIPEVREVTAEIEAMARAAW